MTSYSRGESFQMYGGLVGIVKKNEVVGQYLDRIVECIEPPFVRAVNRCS